MVSISCQLNCVDLMPSYSLWILYHLIDVLYVYFLCVLEIKLIYFFVINALFLFSFVKRVEFFVRVMTSNEFYRIPKPREFEKIQIFLGCGSFRILRLVRDSEVMTSRPERSFFWRQSRQTYNATLGNF